MKYRVLALLMLSLSLSSCNALLKGRKIAHHGTEPLDLELPVIVYNSADPSSRRILFLLSGDGGWIDFDDELALKFQQDGYNVIGFNSRSYFWEEKTPRETAADFALLIKKYSSLYKANRIYLAGYSCGADVSPFIYNLLPPDEKRKVAALELLSPYSSTDFDIHLIDLINLGGDNRTFKVRPEIEKIKIPVYCFYGDDEDPKPLADIKQKNFVLKTLPGDHRYDESAYPDIVSALRTKRPNRR